MNKCSRQKQKLMRQIFVYIAEHEIKSKRCSKNEVKVAKLEKNKNKNVLRIQYFPNHFK